MKIRSKSAPDFSMGFRVVRAGFFDGEQNPSTNPREGFPDFHGFPGPGIAGACAGGPQVSFSTCSRHAVLHNLLAHVGTSCPKRLSLQAHVAGKRRGVC